MQFSSAQFNKKLIRRWDSERELFYDNIVHVLKYENYAITYAEVYKNFIVVKSDLQLKLKIILSK